MDGGQVRHNGDHQPQGTPIAKAGDKRDGGSYYERMGKVVCWNSLMDNDRYLIQKWNEFSVA